MIQRTVCCQNSWDKRYIHSHNNYRCIGISISQMMIQSLMIDCQVDLELISFHHLCPNELTRSKIASWEDITYLATFGLLSMMSQPPAAR